MNRGNIILNAQHLSKILTTKLYKKILDDLLRAKVIEKNNHYLPGKKSRSYRLTDAYINCTYRKIECGNINFSNKIYKLKEITLSPIHKEIKNNLKDFHFDFESAIKLLESQYGSGELNNHQYIQQKIVIENINDRGYLTVSKKTGRIFHNFTNLKKEYRKFIYIPSGEPLIEVDISNSQPLFFSALLSGNVNISNFNFQNNQTRFEYLYKADQCEKDKFTYFATEGILYPYLSIEVAEDLDSLKKNVFSVLFSKPHWISSFKSSFSHEFPSITKFIDEFKKENHSDFAILLQSLESNFIIQNVAPKLLEMKINFIPIHDSFLVPEAKTARVVNVMKTTFLEKYNLPLTIKFKKYSDQTDKEV